MKVLGVVIIVLGLAVAYIGITGSQHRIMAILKGVHLSPGAPAGSGVAKGNAGPLLPTGGGGKKKA